MGPVGLPRRSLGRFVSSLASSEDRIAGGASFCLDFSWSVVLSPFFSSGLVLGEDAGGLVEADAGGVADGVEPAGEGEAVVVEGAAEGGEAGDAVPVGVVEGPAGLDVVSLLVKRGGASVVSIPFGTSSAFIPLLGASDPAASHAPVASHGTSALAARLCSALLIVNRPRDTPVFSPSYTVPDSSAMGTGSAL